MGEGLQRDPISHTPLAACADVPRIRNRETPTVTSMEHDNDNDSEAR